MNRLLVALLLSAVLVAPAVAAQRNVLYEHFTEDG